MNEERLITDQQKEVSFYNALVNTWIQTNMELDKTLITISAAGIGLLVTLLSTAGVSSYWHIAAYFVAFGLFITTILTCVKILRKNAKHIEQVLKGNDAEDKSLKALDRIADFCFSLALVFLMTIGVISAIDKLSKQGVSKMADNESPKIQLLTLR